MFLQVNATQKNTVSINIISEIYYISKFQYVWTCPDFVP